MVHEKIINKPIFVNTKELMKGGMGMLISSYYIILVFATGSAIYSRNCIGEIVFRIFAIQQFFAVYSEELGSAEYLF